MRRVVVTGLGMLTPLGSGVDINWRRLISGQSGIKKITNFEPHLHIFTQPVILRFFFFT